MKTVNFLILSIWAFLLFGCHDSNFNEIITETNNVLNSNDSIKTRSVEVLKGPKAVFSGDIVEYQDLFVMIREGSVVWHPNSNDFQLVQVKTYNTSGDAALFRVSGIGMDYKDSYIKTVYSLFGDVYNPNSEANIRIYRTKPKINGVNIMWRNQTTELTLTDVIPAAASIIWRTSAGGQIISGQGTNRIMYKNLNSTGEISVFASISRDGHPTVEIEKKIECVSSAIAGPDWLYKGSKFKFKLAGNQQATWSITSSSYLGPMIIMDPNTGLFNNLNPTFSGMITVKAVYQGETFTKNVRIDRNFVKGEIVASYGTRTSFSLNYTPRYYEEIRWNDSVNPFSIWINEPENYKSIVWKLVANDGYLRTQGTGGRSIVVKVDKNSQWNMYGSGQITCKINTENGDFDIRFYVNHRGAVPEF